MRKPELIEYIENRWSRKPLAPDRRPHASCLRDGFSAVVIGGGIAGPAFARRLLSLAAEHGIGIKITLVSRPSCNYCGGLITRLSLETLKQLYEFELPREIVVREIDEVVLINPSGSASVRFEAPLASVFRTSRFGATGFDDSFRKNILSGLPASAGEMLSVVEPAVATSIELPTHGKRGTVTYTTSHGVEQTEADLIVIATGLRSLRSKLISSLTALTGYRPPPLMPACVTEIDSSTTGASLLGRRLLILNGIIEGSVVAIIPKHHNWLTVAALRKVLTTWDLRRIFMNRHVTDYVEVDRVDSSLACGTVCSSGVYTGPAKNFYGDGWLVLGDLTGYGRLLKDGYYAALLGADLAARTCFKEGCTYEAFSKYYHQGLRIFDRDNRLAMTLFSLNNHLSNRRVYNRAMLAAFRSERACHPYGGLAHSAFRAISTGELAYSSIGLLFVAGLAAWAFRHPAQALAAACKKDQRVTSRLQGLTLGEE